MSAKFKTYKKYPKAGKTCKSCGHLIVYIPYRGYKCFCDKCNAQYSKKSHSPLQTKIRGTNKNTINQPKGINKNLMKTKDIAQLCEKIEQLTCNNCHTEAKIEIAKFFGYTNFVKIFQAIETIHNAEGHLSGEICDYRTRKGKELIECIKINHGAEIAQKVYNSL